MDYEEVEAAGKEAAYYHTLQDMVTLVNMYGVTTVMADLFDILHKAERAQVNKPNDYSHLFEDVPF
jgi:hypothetical protein